jgi:DNA-binding MarR family transcriptional regulator
MTDPIAAIEYEALLFSRHLAGLPGRTRRRGGLLDQSAYTLLSLLEVGGPASIGDLNAITGLDVSTLNRQTAALLREGFAERFANPEGGIARLFRPTHRGRQILQEEREASRGALEAITSDWDEEERAAFASALERLNREIERRSGRSWPRR